MATIVEQPRQLLLDSLRHMGYGQGHVEVNWPYLNLAALGERDFGKPAGRLDIAAFLDERRHDWETSAIVCDLQSPEVLANAETGRQRCRMLFDATASPNVLFGGADNVDLWLGCETHNPRRIAGIGFNAGALRRAFADHRDSLERESLSRLRLGQRYLFDRVYEARRDQLADFMHVGLEQAVHTLRSTVGKSIQKAEQEALELSLSYVAMALLAARIMEDKDFFGEQDSPSANARNLVKRAESASNGFFRHVTGTDLSALDKRLGPRVVDDLLSHIMAYLTGPACFSLITPDMLGDLYERALVANDRVGRSVDIKGIHYTPLSMAQHILRRIPIEEIPPSKRCILDPACGSGSFLMAATARLRDAFDANEPDAEDDVLEHLSSRVIGNDMDTIARLVTQMRYLLHHWIETGSSAGVPTPKLLKGDGLELKPADFAEYQPTVIVGNPPFNPATTAAKFLEKSIRLLAPGGFLGMIMPAAFLRMRRDRCPDARYELLNTCALLDVAEMPERTVGATAEQPTCFVIARKQIDGKSRSVMFRQTFSRQGDAVSEFRDHLRATWVFAADALPATNRHWRDDPYRVSDSNQKPLCRIIASPIDAIWRSVESSCTLGDLCGHNIVPGIWACGPESVFSSDDIRPAGFEPYFQHQGRLLPYFLERSDWENAAGIRGLYVDPKTARWRKEPYWRLYREPKVLVTARSNRNAKTQITASFDELGVFPEDVFRCIGFDLSARLEDAARTVLSCGENRSLLLWVAAILNSALGQAWIAITSSPRGLSNEALSSLPLPRTVDLRISELVEVTREVGRPDNLDNLTLWSQWSDRRPSSPGSDFATIAGQLNCLVFRSYELSREDFLKVTRYLESMTNPWVNGSADAHIVTYPERRIRGTVLSVDTMTQQITVRLSRYSSDPLRILIPHDFPGWAMAEGSEFTCLAPRNDRNPQNVKTNPWLLRDFRPLPYAYLTVKQLEKMVLQKSPGD